MNFSAVKQASIRLGLYTPARSLYRHTLGRHQLARMGAETAFFRSLIPDGALVFDVGANIGEKSESLLRAGCRVVAFEPQVECVAELDARCRRFGDRFRSVAMGVGATCGRRVLNVSPDSGTSSLIDGWLSKVPKERRVIPMTTLDAAIAEFGLPAYIKLDIEGFEAEALRGLSCPVPLVSFEYHMSDPGKVEACIDLLASFGVPMAANFTPGESWDLAWPEWESPDWFRRRFPAELDGRDDRFWGDVFVRAG